MKFTDHATHLLTRASEGVGKLRAANAVLAEAESANQSEHQRLATLETEITEREHRLDPESLAEVADLEARKKQLSLLRAKAVKEAASRLESARLKAASLVADAGLPGFFKDAYDHYFEHVRTSLLPFVDERLPIETEALSRTVNGLSGIARLHQWRNWPPSADKALEILQRFIEGQPLWRA